MQHEMNVIGDGWQNIHLLILTYEKNSRIKQWCMPNLTHMYTFHVNL